MRLAVQQLLGSSVAVDLFTRAPQRAQEEIPVGLSERWRFNSIRDQPLGLGDAVGEVRCCDLDASHRRMQVRERFCVLGR